MTASTLSIHYAESAEDQEYFAHGSGKMAEFLRVLGACHPGDACHPEAQPKDLLEILRGACPRAQRRVQNDRWLAVHCNTVSDADIAMLKATQATVVHCPRSHRYFLSDGKKSRGGNSHCHWHRQFGELSQWQHSGSRQFCGHYWYFNTLESAVGPHYILNDVF